MVRLFRALAHVAPFIVLALAATVLGVPNRADAQVHDQRWTRNDDGRSFTMSVRGKVWFTDDDRDIERIEPDGRVMIEEKWRGGPGRMIIITPTPNGGVQRVYLLDGTPHAFDADAQAWLAGLLPAIVRESGVGAVERAKRIYGKKGATGVLDEIELINSNSTRRIYLTTLIENWKLSTSDAARALRATGGMSSNSEKAGLLVAARTRLEMSEPLVRGAYMDAARTISSSSELRRVLTSLLDEQSLPEQTLVDALRVSSDISSNSERAAVLARAAERHKLSSNELRSAFFSSAEGISSNSEKRRVLVTLLRAQGTDREVVRGVVKSARGISSDSEKAAVLLEVPAVSLKDPGTVDAYRDTMDTIRSRASREPVASRVGGFES
jgi:hypothetical protein